jgi:hypothetical protein
MPPTEAFKKHDLYGSLLRLNPNSNERSYARRRWYVRFVSGTGGNLYYACASAGDAAHHLLPGIPTQDVTARQVGPDSYEVDVEYYRPTINTRMDDVIQMGTVAVQERVFRLPYTVDAGDNATTSVDADSGLPTGDWIGYPKSGVDEAAGKVVMPIGVQEVPSVLWPVPVSTVIVRGRITSVQWVALFAGSGTASNIGKWNSVPFVFAGITFSASTLRFDGMTNSVTTGLGDAGAVTEYNVSYKFTWKPKGWSVQRIKKNPTLPGSLDTDIVSEVGPTVDYTGLFPTS